VVFPVEYLFRSGSGDEISDQTALSNRFIKISDEGHCFFAA
jgi:hypothetical protein